MPKYRSTYSLAQSIGGTSGRSVAGAARYAAFNRR
ncbi:hypothetical protein ACVWXQ_004262 [Bradyrhizobium sp. S3.14.4]